MTVSMDKPWDERRESLLGDLISLIYQLDQDQIPHVSHDIDHIYVHFLDENGTDIGNLAFGNALHSLHNDVYLFPDASTECDGNGEPVGDLDIRDASNLDIQTH